MTYMPHAPSNARLWLSVLATTLGGVLEWYDLILYGLFAVTLSHLFFPATTAGFSLLLSLGSFGVAFVARPIGAAWLGSYADRKGRRQGLVLSSLLMTVGTGLLAVVPSYGTIGLAAPLIVVFSRLLQGFAAGGEFGGAATMLAERSPKYRGVYSSLQWSAGGVAVTLASAVAWLVHQAFTEAQILAWAWRLPFALGMVLGPLTAWLRLISDESPEFKRQDNHQPVREVIRHEPLRLLLGMGLVSAGATGSYLNIYMPTLAKTQLHLGDAVSFMGTMVSGVLTIILPPLFALLGDKVGRRGMMAVMAAAGGLMAWPLFHFLVASPSGLHLVLVQAFLVTTVYCGYYASVPALFAEIFLPRNRTTAIALSYALGQLVFGGFTPMILSVLVTYFQDKSIPGFYLLGTVVLSLVCLACTRQYAGRGQSLKSGER
ncbi:major facilitator superfamily MFS_1 [Acetobacter malorum]|uniref:Major facilitator superfamily MFS_1 n=1 Tax=Acetobacter malorum TaxID=178901 RepID=A0A177G745_9PROT|nr:major facilitator superfamily MFS_1 [Acetobacter malorum]